MVKIAVAGGSGEVGREVLDALVAAGKHEVVILSRNANAALKKVSLGPSTSMAGTSLTWHEVNYVSKTSLVDALRGIHTVLSFTGFSGDPEHSFQVQKNLIDAAILAGVKRFAPSEWGSSGIGIPLWAGKERVREYLKSVNDDEKVLEYSLFQPGLFLDYLATPYKTAKHLTPLNTIIDLQNRRAILVDGVDAVMNLTTVKDLAAVVVRAVEYEGAWPVVGGVCGNKVLVSKILDISEKVRGRPFTIDTVRLSDLENGILTSSWSLEASHSSFTGSEVAELLKIVLIGTLVSSAKGAWAGNDEWNRLLPDYEFAKIEEFLTEVWEGKP